MPRTKLQAHVSDMKRPRINTIEMIVHGYMKARNLNAEDVGNRLGITGSGFRKMVNRPAGSWSVTDIQRVCDAVGIPQTVIYNALTDSAY